jgi:hypothetical protein
MLGMLIQVHIGEHHDEHKLQQVNKYCEWMMLCSSVVAAGNLRRGVRRICPRYSDDNGTMGGGIIYHAEQAHRASSNARVRDLGLVLNLAPGLGNCISTNERTILSFLRSGTGTDNS